MKPLLKVFVWFVLFDLNTLDFYQAMNSLRFSSQICLFLWEPPIHRLNPFGGASPGYIERRRCTPWTGH